jgi:hypothetical protein
MTNKSISQLTAGAAVSSTDLFPDVQTAGVGPVKVTAAQIGNYVLSGSGLTGTLPVANGGTGLTSLTAGRIPYGAGVSGTDPFGNSANLFWDATNSRLGVGTASPGTRLDVSGIVRSRDAGFVLSTGTTQNGILGTFNNISGSGVDYTPCLFSETGLGISFLVNGSVTKAMTLDASGQLSIGTTAANAPITLQANSGGNSMRLIGRSSDGYSGLNFYNNANNTQNGFIAFADAESVIRARAYLSFEINGGTPAARIDSSGNLLVGKTVTGETTVGWNLSGNGAGNCKIASGQYFVWNRDTDDIIVNFRRSNTSVGSISVTTTATAYNESSDIRLKQNIQPASSALASILTLPIRQFDWKLDGSHIDYGLVAQETYECAPEIVTKGEIWQVYYGRITPRLIKAFQELAAKVTALEEQLNG